MGVKLKNNNSGPRTHQRVWLKFCGLTVHVHATCEANMPMLNGVDTTKSEVSELKALFQNHKGINHSVELLPNWIKF